MNGSYYVVASGRDIDHAHCETDTMIYMQTCKHRYQLIIVRLLTVRAQIKCKSYMIFAVLFIYEDTIASHL